jgi:predicted permease
VARSERAFARLLALFPPGFRARFGRDMRELFGDQLRAAHAAGGGGDVARLWLRTLLPLVLSALLERRDARRDRRRARAGRPHAHTAHALGGDGMLATLASDLRFALRMLRKSPVFTLVAVLVIALGSGAVTTIFSAMNALLLRPLAGTADARRLVRIEPVKRGDDGVFSVAYPHYEYLRGRTRTLDGLVAWSKAALTVSARGEGAAIYGNFVSGDYFSALGVRPALGRFFAPEETRTELTHPVVVVSEDFWRAHLGGDSAAVGRTVTVNGRPFTLVGVAPAAFMGLDAPIRTDAWVPIMMVRQVQPQTTLTEQRSSWLRMAGRLAPGADAEAVRRELAALTAERRADEPALAEALPFDDFRLPTLTGLPSDATRTLGRFLGLLLGAAALVLLIASVNVASMLSARAVARRREMAVRAALGAARGRLVRQLLTEILLLFALGAVGGVAITAAATNALERIRVPGTMGTIVFAFELSPDLRVLAFALLVSLLTGVAFGLAPALQGARKDITARLRSDSAGGGTRRGLLGNALVVGQLALSLVLLVAAGLFLRALDRGHRIDPGFDANGVAVASLDATSWGYDDARARPFYRALREQVAAIPGVTSVTYAEKLPLVFNSSMSEIHVDGAAAPAGDRRPGARVRYDLVDADYFATIRMPLVAGRAIDAGDDERAPRVAVVNQTLARLHFADGGAVGRTFRFDGQRVTIVGIARDAKYASLSEDAAPPMAYFPISQHWRPSRSLLVRSALGAEQLAPAIQRAVRALDPALPRPMVSTLRYENRIVLLPQRVAAMVTGALGGVGLLLASVGLYGVIAYSVNRRTREIGIRLAIGAGRGDVLGMVVRDGMRLAGVGVVVGVALAAGATRLMRSLLFDVSPLDAATFGAMSLLFVAVALLASWLPARRAASADPRVALRAE